MLKSGRLAQVEAAHEAERQAMEARQFAESQQRAAVLLQSIERGRREREQIKRVKTERQLKDMSMLAEASVAAANASNDLEQQMGGRRAAGSKGGRMVILGKDERERPLRDGLLLILQRIERDGGSRARSLGKFAGDAKHELSVGRPEAAALGLAAYLRIDEFDLFERLLHGVDAIVDEVTKFGKDVDRECLDYVLNHPAGSSERAFENGTRDVGRSGEMLDDFVRHPNAKRARLKAAHVLALRLYTTAAFRSINEPLRDSDREEPHPFAATVFFMTDGIRRLRAVEADAERATREADVRARQEGKSRLKEMAASDARHDLWRGMANMDVTADFEAMGGSEMAPMSTTHDPAIASARQLVAMELGKSDERLEARSAEAPWFDFALGSRLRAVNERAAPQD